VEGAAKLVGGRGGAWWLGVVGLVAK